MLAPFLLVFLILMSALMLNISKSPIRSLLYLILIFLLSVLLILNLGIEFIAVVIFIVYVGAISILFLFVIMMLNVRVVDLYSQMYNYIPIGGLIGVLTLFEICCINYSEVFSKQLYVYAYLYNHISYSNISLIGQLLFNYYFHLFIIVSLLLLVSMIGAIVLTDSIRKGLTKSSKNVVFTSKNIITWI